MIQRGDDHAPLSIRSMSVVYGRGHRPEDAALWNASADVRARSMTAIVGPNGAGKSTLLNAALGLVPRLAGDVRFFGRPFAVVRERVAYLPQRESIDWDFPITALDVVRMGATRGSAWWTPRWARPRAAREETTRAMEALGRVGMEDFAERAIGDLSGGQQQRVFLARALAQDADLLLLDEPFAAVDATTEGILRDQLRGAVANGKTVVSVHHDLGSIEELFDDVILVNGTVTDQGPAARVLAGEAFERAFGTRTAGPVGAA